MVFKIADTDECSRHSKKYAEGVQQLSSDMDKLCKVLGELTDIGNNFGTAYEKLQDCSKILKDSAQKAEEADVTMRKFIADFDMIQNTELKM